MVTSGTLRQSSRPPSSPAGRAASASASASRRNTCGISCAWIAIRLTARSLLSEPSRSFTRAVGRPKRPWRVSSTATRSPSCGVRGRAGRDVELAAELLLVDRHQPSAAVRQRAEHAELALPRAVEDLDDAAGVADRVAFLAGLLGAQQHAVADAGDLVRARLARNMDADARRLAVLLGVPFGRNRDQFAVAVALGDVGEHDGGQGAGVVQLLAPPLDLALVGKLAQHVLERGAVVVLQAEGARDLAHAGLALVRADEGEDVFAGGEAGGPGLGAGFFKMTGR